MAKVLLFFFVVVVFCFFCFCFVFFTENAQREIIDLCFPSA